MSYWRELIVERRALLSVVVAGSVAFGLNSYVNSLFIPAMQAEFGWTRSQFAVTSTTALLGLLSYPLAGRLADRYGARPVALVGALALPTTYVGFSFISGNILEYVAIYAFMMMFGAGATIAVYGRILAVRIHEARGLALSLMMSGPPLVGALSAPLLNDFIAEYGWRSGYRLLAAFVLVVGLTGLAFVPRDLPKGRDAEPPLKAKAAYARVLPSRPFWVLAFGMLLCNVGNVLAGVQLKPMLMDSGVSDAAIGGLFSLFAGGVILGRLIFGLSLDRLPTPVVGAVGMGLPAIGLFMIAAGVQSYEMIALAVLMLGLSQGAEGDVGSFAAARYIGPELFGTAYGLIVGIVAAAGSTGALLLAYTLETTDSFATFVAVSAGATAVGAASFLLLWRYEPRDPVPALDGDDAVTADAGGGAAVPLAASGASPAARSPTR